MKDEELILMFKDQEVLSFAVHFGKKCSIKVLEKLEHFERAPYGISEDTCQEEMDRIVFKFFNGRTISSSRRDCGLILKAAGCKNDFELSFKGHGLSLADHYWYRKKDEHLNYDDINFFTNGWDDTFGRAVLNEDYETLKTADLNVPDIVTTGWAVKGWLLEDVPRLYKLGIEDGHIEECLGEVLASRLANRIFGEGEALKYELKTINGQNASVSELMIGIDEELIPLSNIIPDDMVPLYLSKSSNHDFMKKFMERLPELGVPGLREFFVKLMCLRTLCFVADLHYDNISVIRNLNTGEMRVAPLYDLAGAFGGTKQAREILSNLDKGAVLMIFFFYGYIDPDWDYSWYDPKKLEGYEDEIREILSKSEFYTPSLIDNIIKAYRLQKASLDKTAGF